MSKRLPSPDGLDWRDPDMPVVRDYLMPSGKQCTIIDPDYERRYRAYLLENAAQKDWRSDPTYNLRRHRR